MQTGGAGDALGGGAGGQSNAGSGAGVVVYRNHVGTMWRLPEGGTRWIPWLRDGAYGTDHTFSWEITEEAWRERVHREDRQKDHQTAGGGARRRFSQSPIDGKPDNMEVGSTLAYANRVGTQWNSPWRANAVGPVGGRKPARDRTVVLVDAG